MRFLEIKSRGTIEKEAFTLIGASTKRGDESKIGMFGSGLKYGIASIVRQQIPFIVFSGTEEIKFSTKEVGFGGSVFNQIMINGVETSFTDSMGTEDWAGAFPYVREIYSNALDNDENATIKLVHDINPEPGYTTFYIQENNELLRLWNDWSNYFVDKKRVLYSNPNGSIFNATEHCRVFRHGILAHDTINQKSLFNYDLNFLEINESRVAKNTYAMNRLVGELIESCTNKLILRRWISGISGGNAGLFEHDCFLSSWQNTVSNPALVEVILEHKYYPVEMGTMLDESEIKGRLGLSMQIIKRFLVYAPDLDCLGLTSDNGDDNKMKIETKPSTMLFDKVQDALERLKNSKYKDRLNAPIKYCRFSKLNVLGQADEGFIWLSIKLDLYPVDDIAKIIIEEQEHLTSGFDDETRDFQNHLFSLYYSVISL